MRGRVEDIDPIVLVAAEVGDEEGDDCKGGRNSEVARNVGTGREERYQTHAVGEEDEEEQREHVGQVFFIVLLPYHGTHDAVAHKDHKHLHQRLQTFGSLVFTFLIAVLGYHDDDYQQYDDDHDGGRHLGDGEVERPASSSRGCPASSTQMISSFSMPPPTKR